MSIAYICVAVLLIVRYGYIAATESTGPKQSRAGLIATVAFASLFVVLPLLWTGYESQLPIFEFDGVIQSVHVKDSSSKNFSADLSILTSSGGTITVHASDRSNRWHPGQRLIVRYYGETGELIRATFLDGSGKEEGVSNRTEGFARVWSVLLGGLLIWGAWRRYKRNAKREVESNQELTSGPTDSLLDFDHCAEEAEDIDEMKRDAERRLAKQKKWAIIASAAFIASCASVWPFLAGNPLHRYWDTLGVLLLILAMVLLLPFVISVGWAISAWLYARDVKKPVS